MAKTGYKAFNKAYEVMLKNDPHAQKSIDHHLLKTMVRLDKTSQGDLYQKVPSIATTIKDHPLYPIAQALKGANDKATIRNVLDFTKKLADLADAPLDQMVFGGTELEIIARKSDWCSDLTRLGVVLLQCLDIPTRFLYLANLEKAYHGHVVGEAYYENTFGVIDFTYGVAIYKEAPIAAHILLNQPHIAFKAYQKYISDTTLLNAITGYFKAIAISHYNPMDPTNNYQKSSLNRYYKTLLSTKHQGTWLMGEDQA